jgi:hypothetical protein
MTDDEWNVAFDRLDVALDNLTGQAVNWMSEPEIHGHGIPVDLALMDAAQRDAFGPWLGAIENSEAAEDHARWDAYLAEDKYSADAEVA